MIHEPVPKSTCSCSPGPNSIRRNGTGVSFVSRRTKRFTDWYFPGKASSRTRSSWIRLAESPCSSAASICALHASHRLTFACTAASAVVTASFPADGVARLVVRRPLLSRTRWRF